MLKLAKMYRRFGTRLFGSPGDKKLVFTFCAFFFLNAVLQGFLAGFLGAVISAPPSSNCLHLAQLESVSRGTVLRGGESKALRIAVVSSYPPQACGIAEFTRDLLVKGFQKTALAESKVEVSIVVIDEENTERAYGPEVAAVFRKHVASDYVLAADLLNSDFDVVSLQHEYGIFGGEWGELILLLLQRLSIPVVTNFHTVLPDPTVQSRKVLIEIAHLSNMVTVMLPSLCEHLNLHYTENITCLFMPHGAPLEEQGHPPDLEALRISSDRSIILSPGLLSPNKGIESMISAMSTLQKKLPKALYVIVGRQHPGLRGRDYLGELRQLVQEMDLETSVLFVPLYQTKEQLIGWISQSHIVVTPYEDRTQVSSGTLSMTVGLGRVAVTTAFPYAQWLCRAVNEMAATAVQPCMTVPFAEDLGPELASALLAILGNDTLQQAMRGAAFEHGRRAQWTSVSKEWVDLLRQAAVRNRASLLARRGEWAALAASAYEAGAVSDRRLHKVPVSPTDGRVMKVWASDLARDVIMGNRKAEESAKVLSDLTLGPLRFAARVDSDETECMAETGGLGSFFTSNGIAAFHGQVRKDDYVFLHTLPDKGLLLGSGLRYGGMFVNYVIDGDMTGERAYPAEWSFSCQGSNSVLRMKSVLKHPVKSSVIVGEVDMSFNLDGSTSLLTWTARVRSFEDCLDNVEVQSAMDGMSTLFENLHFNQFYAVSPTDGIVGVKSAVEDIELYNQELDGPLAWDVFTNKEGEFALITVIRNQTTLRYITGHDPTNENFHYTVHRYHVGSICPWDPPLIIVEDRIILHNMDLDNVESYAQVIDRISELTGVDVSGPENKALVEEAFQVLAYHTSTASI
ncbi:hypothetical protein KFL_003710150 [Klebsormidium nitens]|uniref:Glycosyl transferase family 1 domain-containing protein n=1 Tax=Klebsormidium nitens TaxID=105231 RepID=A0A1Y1IE77_KLENI|nr:hypothetical protein KFL_003710150 [Klebsormidium nitens]|eukprot:GAQ87709.1 hypothetical protein KFL_003710150 [Klebsormidium nitens]